MTTDSDCIAGVPKSVILDAKATGYFEAVEAALYWGNPTDGFDPTVVWHVRQYASAHDKRDYDGAEKSKAQAMRHCLAVVTEISGWNTTQPRLGEFLQKRRNVVPFTPRRSV